ILADGQRVALVETKTIDSPSDDSPKLLLRYQYQDHLGSAAIELDQNGKTISHEEYYAFGTTSYQAVDKELKAAAKRYRYTGMERDEESGLAYHSARYYMPWLCRWTRPDPIGIDDGVNVYNYAHGNPIGNTDTSGNYCDPSIQSCPELTEPTAREEALQMSLPEDERYLEPASFPEPESINQSFSLNASSTSDEANRIPLVSSPTEEEIATFSAAGVPYFMPDNSADIGTPAHLVVLPVLSARLLGHGIPNFIEALTLPGGSKSGISSGEIDLTVLVPPTSSAGISAIQAHVYDLKPGGSSATTQHAQQVQRYVDYFDNGLVPEVDIVSPQVGTILYDVAARHPDVLAPIDVPGTAGRVYIGLQLTSPGIIEYHLGARPFPIPYPVREPVVERRPVRIDKPDPITFDMPDIKPVPWYVPVGAGIGYVLWNSKGCLAGPWGCVIDWLTPVI
ncbi:MAG: RHS repeat-associated core domain-containing protein, partial [Bacteroidota bacterium]